MGLMQQIEEDVAVAMKAKEELRLATLRLLRAAIKNAEIEMRTKGDYDVEQMALGVIRRQLKQTEEASLEFAAGGRQDLVEKAQGEMAILQSYLPAQMTDAALEKIVDEVIAGWGTVNPQMIGKVIGEVVKRAGGAADGNRVRAVVQKKLTPS